MTAAVARAPIWGRLDLAVERIVVRGARARARDEREFAVALRVIAAALRVGSSMPQALARASDRCDGRVAAACGAAAARITLGAGVEAELAGMAVVLQSSPAHLLAQIVAVQHRRGGDLARPCGRLAALVDERARLDAEGRSATAQARFAGRAVVAIPGLLALAAWWRAPEVVARLLTPGAILIAAPGIAAIVVGSCVASRIGGAAGRSLGRAPRPHRSLIGPWLHRIVGDGPRSLGAVRLAAVTLAAVVPLTVLGGGRPLMDATAALLVVCAAAWPWAEVSARRRAAARTAEFGIEALLEVSIALFAAGATAHDVARIAPASVDEPLRSTLRPAVHRVELGRTVASAFGSLPVVSASPHLDAWLHAITSSAELGSSSIDVLEGLLRDARAARRESIRSAAQTAGPRMQLALVLLVVPGIMWVMLVATVGSLVDQLRGAGVV